MQLCYRAAFCLVVVLLCAVSASGQSGLSTILSRYQMTLGDAAHIQQLSGLQLNGYVVQGDQQAPFTSYRSSRNDMRVAYQLPEQTVIQVVNAEGVWQWTQGNVADSLLRIEGRQESWLRREAQFLGPLLDLDSRLVREVQFSESIPEWPSPVDIIALQHDNGDREWFYLDSHRFRLVMRRFIAAGETDAMTSHYRDYRRQGHLLFPHRITNRFAGITISTVVVESIVINPGVMGFYFKPPQGHHD